ncbi:MAG: S1 RNA-binding domain-containing protein [Acidobacteriota bacterium]|jgi:small subunit ribosomal protein S1
MTEQNDQRDFGAILAEFERTQEEAGSGKDPEAGTRVSGTILSIGEEAAFVDVGAKSDAMVAISELTEETEDGEQTLTVAVGDTVEGMVTGKDDASGCLILRVRPGGSGLGAGGTEIALEEISQAHEHAIPVEGMVTEAIKGGVQVEVSGVRAFCPISQLDLRFVEDPATYVGRRLTFLVKRFESSGRGGRPNVVLSRRELLEEEERQRKEDALARLSAGAVVRGTVTSVTSYGAFVDLGGVEGLLHVSEMSHGRVEDPESLLSAGDVVEVKILSIEEGDKGKRISLSTKALQKDPWEVVEERFPAGEVVGGRVTRLEPYGAFVEIAPGLDGLVHVSELDPGRRVAHPRDVVELGQDVQVRVLNVDPVQRRISLSMASPLEAADTPSAAEYSAGAKSSGGGFGSLAAAFEKVQKDDD